MGAVILSLLFGLIDPFLWIKSMSTLGVNKSKIKYVGAFLGAYLITIIREFIGNYKDCNLIGICLSLILVIYILLVTIGLFEGGTKEKIINVCLFFFLLFMSELIVMTIVFLFLKDNSNFSFTSFKVVFLYSCISRILLAIGCYFVYAKGKFMNVFYNCQECIPLAIINIVFDMLASAVINDTRMKDFIHIVLLLGIGQMSILWNILYVSYILKKKDKRILELEREMSENEKRLELLKQINQLKEDFSKYIATITELLKNEQYDKLNDYAFTALESLENIELLYNHPNITVGILIGELKEASKKMQVPFSPSIQVRDFGISNEDICCLLRNLVMDRLEAASKVHHETAHVSLQILYNMAGYEIRCINECVETEDVTESSEKERERIIHKIVKKNHGTIEMKCMETDLKGIRVVVTSIQIPLEGGGWPEE